jgi:hypothetical protein
MPVTTERTLMNTSMASAVCGAALTLICSAANAVLLGRLPATPGGSNYQAYYDTQLNITWVADANLAATNNFGVTGFFLDASMVWTKANEWIAAMNTAAYLGKSDWRRPVIVDTGSPGCDFAFSGTDCGYNVQTASGSTVYSEMAHLHFVTLGNAAYFDPSGNLTGLPGCSSTPPYCLVNVGPFANLHASQYWSATQYAPDTTLAWGFDPEFGNQFVGAKTTGFFVWAVRDGDMDTDSDGLVDHLDNCTLVPNPTQLDSDGDGYGNICDADFNNDGVVNINDLNRLKARLNIVPVVDLITDLDGNGAVNINDLNRLKSYLGKPPGPSGLHP